MAHFARRFSAVLVAVLVAVLSASACGGGSTSSVNSNALCTSVVFADITAGTTPTITWTPSCRVAFISIANANNGDVQWAVGLPAGFSPPVKYGVAPTGATTSTGPITLVTGTAYTLTLFTNFSAGGAVGGGTFTP